MSSRTHRDEEAVTTPSPSVPADFPPDRPPAEAPQSGRTHGRRSRWVVITLAVALVLALGAGGYLLNLSRAWQERAEALEGTAHDLGGELGQVRAELEESRSTLALVESQLDGAQEQIHELADTVAQTGDDREVQRQVAEYQGQVSAAATAVAEAMDQCIASQQALITHLEEAARPAPTATPSATPDATAEPEDAEEPAVDVAALREDTARLCQLADDANASLQERLGEG